MLMHILDVAFHDIAKGKLYPAVSLKKPSEQIRANFGESPFMYNIDDIVKVRFPACSSDAFSSLPKRGSTGATTASGAGY